VGKRINEAAILERRTSPLQPRNRQAMPLNCHRVDTPTATTDRKPSYIAIATKHCPPPSTAKLRKTCPSTVRLSARIDTPQSKSVKI
jgi:hypothetical protein